MYNYQDHTAVFYTAHKFELSNEYEATAMPDTSPDIKELSILEKLTHASIAIIDIHTACTIGNVYKSMRYALKFTISL